MRLYKAILFSTDGSDYVTDYFACESIFEVEQHLANQGSRWYFYPYEFVICDRGFVKYNQRIVSAPEYPGHLAQFKGKTIRSLQKYLQEHGNEIAQYL